MFKISVAAVVALVTFCPAKADDLVSSGTTPPTPGCHSTAGQPILLVRNLIPGTTITSIYAKPYSAYNDRTEMFLSAGSFIGGQVNLLGTRVLKGKKMDEIVGDDDTNPGRCGFPINFGSYGFKKECSKDAVENIYQVAVGVERDGKKFTVTLSKDVCQESMLDITPGMPSDGSDKIAAGQGMSGAIADCETTVGEPKLLLRNLITGAVVTSVRARPLTDYNRTSHEFMTNANGVQVSTKSIPGTLYVSGSCGVPINFGQYEFPKDCPTNKIKNLYEIIITAQREGQPYKMILTKNVCEETMIDLLPGIPTFQ